MRRPGPVAHARGVVALHGISSDGHPGLFVDQKPDPPAVRGQRIDVDAELFGHLLVGHPIGHDAAGPKELRERVTSPGGTTQAAIAHLETHKWREIFIDAVHRARQRSAELGE